MFSQPTGPDTPPDGYNINDVKQRFLNWILNQSPALIIALIGLFVLWQKTEKIEAEERACREEINQLHINQNNELIKSINRLNGQLEILRTQNSEKK